MPGGWTRVSEDLGSRVFERRRGRTNPRSFRGDFLLECGGLQDFELVDFLVLPRLECQLAGLASPRASVLESLNAARQA